MTNRTPPTDTLLAASEPTLVRGACPHDCPDTCGTIVEVVDGRAVGFYGDPNHPITDGWLCGKVRPYLAVSYTHLDVYKRQVSRTTSRGSCSFSATARSV